MKRTLIVCALLTGLSAWSQKVMTPEMMVQLGKLSALGISKDGKSIVYAVKRYNLQEDKSATTYYTMPVTGGAETQVTDPSSLLLDSRISADGSKSISAADVKVKKIFASDFHPDVKKADALIYTDLNYRHWDEWEDGAFSHVFVNTLSNGKVASSTDIMKDEPYDCPQKPFGGEEDFIWAPDGKSVLYVTKKKYGKDYAVSTNTDIYAYDIASGTTTNLTEGMMGYDTKPAYSSTGVLAWLSMKTDGYESDKNDVIVLLDGKKINLTKDWDGTVDDFKWSADGKRIYFTAATDGTVQIYTIDYAFPGPKKGKKPDPANPVVKQFTKGDFDVRSMVGQSGNTMIIERTDMNHAAELYSVDLSSGQMTQLSHINDQVYSGIAMSKIERRYLTASDGKPLLVWVIYPPNFDASKKYPTLLYCQGGPQSPLTQYYSFRWNFQVMAAQGYVVVAPNRRGMPGHGVAWNEQISRDYGGQNMKDYLISIDELSKEPFVDKDKRGCVGASYGGYSVFFLAGIHEKRFKSFISHDGIFDWKSMYGTTEEVFFVNQDLGGPYWDKDNVAAQKSCNEFNPINYVKKWDTPIMIVQGGKDYRVPIEQGLQAFQAAQLQGIKSKLLYFPNENHWVLKEGNSIVWHREFYNWLKETLK